MIFGKTRLRLLSPLLVLWLSHASLASEKPIVTGVVAVGMTVSDMDRSVEFYSHVLHFQKISDAEFDGDAVERLKGLFGIRLRVVEMQLGEEKIELSEYLAPRGRPIPVESRSNDRWFQHIAIIVREMDTAYAWLRQNKVQHASSGPQRLPDWNKNAAGIKAFYFRDPDGHNLEILQFPDGKGDPKWHRADGDLFMGIDHTAIVVGDTERSIAFYRDLLGMRVAGESENYGAEQEHLNNVHGARLRITALRAASGPGIELLEYLSPRDGRALPGDLRANDLAHWETALSSSDEAVAWRSVRSGHVELISSQPVNAEGRGVEFFVKDPDGHAVGLLGTDQPNANWKR